MDYKSPIFCSLGMEQAPRLVKPEAEKYSQKDLVYAHALHQEVAAGPYNYAETYNYVYGVNVAVAAAVLVVLVVCIDAATC